MRRRQRVLFLVIGLTASSVIAACASGKAAEAGAAHGEPASVTVVGHGNLHRITLTPDAALRIGLATATVEAADTAHGATVPTAAVIYDEDGRTWVYLQTAPLSFQRARVVVARTAGPVTTLRSGPPVGSVVATVGVAELRGAEDGVPGEQ